MGREEVLAECRLAGVDLVEENPVGVRRIHADVELAALGLPPQRLDGLLNSPPEIPLRSRDVRPATDPLSSRGGRYARSTRDRDAV